MAPTPLHRPTRRRRTAWVAVAVIAVGGVTACGGDDDDVEAPSRTSSAEVSEYLLPADAVGADDREALRIRYVLPAVQCGPEDTVLWNGADAGDFARYDADGGTVVLGSWPAADRTERALESLTDRLDEGYCADEAGDPGTSRWGVRPLEVPGVDDVVAFSTVTRTSPDDEVVAPLSEPAGDAEETYTARAYGIVDRRGVAVQVESGSEPVPAERVAELWQAQAERVRAEAG